MLSTLSLKNDFFDINFVETYAIFVQKGGFVSEF